MNTGYLIACGRIVGPAGHTGYSINNANHIVGPSGDTRHWIYDKHIYSSTGNTGFWIDDTKIHGPVAEPPWERRNVNKKFRNPDLPVC